jgi:prophage maintenance system killer protein
MTLRLLTAGQIVALHRSVVAALDYVVVPPRDESILTEHLRQLRFAAAGGEDLAAILARLAVALSVGRPFAHDNRQTALVAIQVTLRLNRVDLPDDPERFALAAKIHALAAEGRAELAAWLRERLRPTDRA